MVFSAPVIDVSVKSCIVNVLDIPFQNIPRPINQVFSYFAQCRCDIDLRGVLVKFLKYLPPVHVKCKVNTAIQYYNVMILSTDFQNLC